MYLTGFMVGPRTRVELPYSAFKRKRWDLFVGCTAGMYGSVAMYLCLRTINPVAAVWTCIAPFVVVSLALMFGNWSRHAFVKPDDQLQLHGLAYTVLNHPDNQRSFNDGFHTLHRVSSQIRWTDFHSKFVEKLDEHAEKDALVFNGIGFFDVGFALFFHRHGFLADRYVNIGRRSAVATR